MPRKVLILGGGISGLAAAWYLTKKYRDIEVTVLERTRRLGGWIQTHRQEQYLFELGPHSCRTAGSGVATLELIEQLGLQSDVIVPSTASRHRYIYTEGELCKVPSNIWSFVRSPLTRPMLWPLLKEWMLSPSQVEDESVYDFAARRLGIHAAEKLIDPLVSGIYAGDPKQLSLKSCFPFLYECEQKYGSIWQGLFRCKREHQTFSPFVKLICKHQMFSLKGGMQQLVDVLASRLDAQVITECVVQSIQEGTVTTSKGIFEADEIINALPARELFHLTQEPTLGEIPFASVAVVCLGYPTQVLNREGFGYLIPSSEMEKLLGVIWDSSVFPEHNSHPEETRLTCMIGGMHMADFENYTTDDFLSIAQEGLARHLRIKEQPQATTIKLAVNAIPQYTCGHAKRLSELQSKFTMSLIGNSYHGISVNDCIANARSLNLK